MNIKKILILVMVLLVMPLVSAAWDSSDYDYYKIINITPSSGAVVFNRTTINLTVDTATLIGEGKMQADCDDLRIVYNDDIELDRVLGDYDFLNGTGCDSASTDVFFQIPGGNITAEDFSNYKMYYGYASASNPPALAEKVFLVYENCSNVSEWTIGNGWNSDGSVCSTTADGLSYIAFTGAQTSGYHLSFDVECSAYCDIYLGTTTNDLAHRILSEGGTNWFGIFYGGSTFVKKEGEGDLDTSTWYSLAFKRNGDDWDGWFDGGPVTWDTVDNTYGGYKSVGRLNVFANSRENRKFDDILFYLSENGTGPLLDLGPEEGRASVPPNATVWINSTQPTYNYSNSNVIGSFVCISSNLTSINYNATWYKEGVEQFSYNNLIVGNNTQEDLILNSSNLTKGDLWKLGINCWDNINNSVVNSSEILIRAKELPSVTVWINSTSPTQNTSIYDVESSFTCTGPDSTLYYNISWLKNDVVQFAFIHKSTTNHTQVDEVLKAGNISNYDYWNSEIECCNSESNCTIVNSSKIYIEGVPNINEIWINSTAPALNTSSYDLVGSFVCNYTEVSENISIGDISEFEVMYGPISGGQREGMNLDIALDLNGVPYVGYQIRNGAGFAEGWVTSVNTVNNTLNNTMITAVGIDEGRIAVAVNKTGGVMFNTRGGFVPGVGGAIVSTGACTAGEFGATLVTDTNGKPHIVDLCYDDSGTLSYCNLTGGSWSCLDVANPVSNYAMIKMDYNNSVHLVYINNTGDWMYCVKGESNPEFLCEETGINSSKRSNNFGIVIDNSNTNPVSHFTVSSGAGNLTYCNRSASGFACENLTLNFNSSALALDDEGNVYIVWTNVTGSIGLIDNTLGFWNYTVLNNSGQFKQVAIESKIGPRYQDNFNDAIYIAAATAAASGGSNYTLMNISLNGTGSNTVRYNVSWLRNNITQFTFNDSNNVGVQINNTLESENLTSGDLWNIESVCCYGDLCSPSINSTQLKIEAPPPQAIGMWMNTTSPIQNTTLDNITLWFSCYSEELTNIYYVINWSVNGNIVGNGTEGWTTNYTINSAFVQQESWLGNTEMYLREGDNVSASVTCWEDVPGSGAGVSSGETNNTVDNTTIISNGLSVGNVTITHNNPESYAYVNSTLKANVTWTRSVAGTGTVYFTWFRNGLINRTDSINVSVNNSRVDAPYNITPPLTIGDVWTMSVNSSGSPWSEEANESIAVHNFLVNPPYIERPVNGTIVINSTVEARCSLATGGNGTMQYEIYLDEGTVPPTTLVQNTSSRIYTYNVTNRTSSLHYVRCRATDGINTSDYSGVVNFTVNNIPLYTAVTSQVSPTFTGAVNPFSINLSWNTDMLSSISARLNYDGNQYSPTTTSAENSTLTYYEVSLTAPDKDEVNWYWNISLTYKAGASGPVYNISYNGTQLITNWTLTPMANHSLCDGLVVLNLTLADEPTRIVKRVSNGSIGINLDYWLGSNKYKRNVIYTNYTNELVLCLSNVSIPSIIFDGAVIYGDEFATPVNYDNRFYYFCNNNYTNITNEINLYQLNISTSTGAALASQVGFTVTDIYGNTKGDEIIQVWRNDIGLTPDILVAMGQTDNNGQTMIWLDRTGETKYSYRYYDGGTCSLDKSVSATVLWEETQTETILDPALAWIAIDRLTNVSSAITNDSDSCIFEYTNNSGAIDEVCMSVNALEGGSVEVISQYCTSGTNSFSWAYTFPNVTKDVVYSCSMTAREGINYKALGQLSVPYSSNTSALGKIRSSMGVEGLFAVLLLVGILMFAAIGNTSAIIIIGVIGIIMAYVLGLISFANPALVISSLVVIAIVLVWRIQK